MGENDSILNSITGFITEYERMDICGTVINCPYWMNRIKDGKVVLRGFANGKGTAEEIRNELLKRLNSLPDDIKFPHTEETLRKFARREKIGIDCSGFVYRVLDKLLRLGYGNTGYKNLDRIFGGGIFQNGINNTNVKRLTNGQYCREIKDICDFRLGDIIRLWGGRHVALIIGNTQKEILYVHSSHLSTKIQGVHTSIIRLIDMNKSLADQHWMEETRTGENFGKKYFRPEDGDGVYRLKIFHAYQTR